MATANLVQRTFGKGFSISDSTPLTVSCVDSGGNLIKCNYLGISVNPGGNTVPLFFISPQVGSLTVHPSSIGVSLSSTAATSGAYGVCLTTRTQATGGQTYEYMCLPNESFSLINICTLGATSVNSSFIALTYGVVQEFNPAKAKDKYSYDLGR